jgi:hypothetical protein
VLVASKRNSRLPVLYSARVMLTVSGRLVGLAVGVRVAVGVVCGGGGTLVAVRVGVWGGVAGGRVGGTAVGVAVPPGGWTVRAAVRVTPTPATEPGPTRGLGCEKPS